VKQAILATVVAVVKKNPGSVAVLLKSEELREATRVVYTGLNQEHSFKRSETNLEVICSGDPKAKAGDKVPVIVDLEPIQKVGSTPTIRDLRDRSMQSVCPGPELWPRLDLKDLLYLMAPAVRPRTS